MSMHSRVPLPPSQQFAPVQNADHQTFAIMSLVFGIVAMVGALVPFVSLFAFLPAVAAVVFGAISIAKKLPGYGKALSGVILGAVAFLTALIVTVSFFSATSSTRSVPSTIGDEMVEELTGPGESSDGSGALPETSAPTPTPSAPAPSPSPSSSPQIPAGFTDAGEGLAYQFTADDCYFYEWCVTVELYAYDNCPAGVAVYGYEIDMQTDEIFAETGEEGPAMVAGDRQLIEVGIFDPSASGIELTELICYY